MSDPNTPTPPFILVEGLPNFRDIGGYPIAGQPGKTVRRGIVFRSSEPSKTTDAGIALLQELRITDVYDLRSKQEMEKESRDGETRHAKEWEGARRIEASVFVDTDYSPEALAVRFKNYADNSTEGFINAYQDILKSASSPENAAQPYKAILGHLASASPTPVLLHCTAGKDRTGVICALVLSLCGTEDEVVAHEYSLTEIGLRSRISEFIKYLVTDPALKDNPQGARRMIGSRRENMLVTLAKIREIWGSVEQCVQALGFLTAAQIEQLRANLIVDVAPGETLIDWRSHVTLVDNAMKQSDDEAERLWAAARV